MSKIDWNAPLEAVNRDNGEVHILDPMRPNNNQFWPFVAYSQSRGDDFFLNPEHEEVNSGNSTSNWYVRNRQPTQTATDRLERLEAFVARVATGMVGTQVAVDDAKALVAEIAPPVDRDILTARKIALDYALEADNSDYIQAIVEALRRARNEGNAA